MNIAGIAIGGIEEIPYRGKKVKTGIFKKPIRGPILPVSYTHLTLPTILRV